MTQRVTPQLRSTNWQRTRAFYEDGLGFRVEWEHRFEPHFPVFMQVSRDGMALFLTEHRGDCPVGGLLHLYVPDVDAWHVELQGRGIPILEPPNDDLPGVRVRVNTPQGLGVRGGQRGECDVAPRGHRHVVAPEPDEPSTEAVARLEVVRRALRLLDEALAGARGIARLVEPRLGRLRGPRQAAPA